MNKTIFNLDYKSSIIIISILGILFAFLSNAFYVNNFLGFILYVLRFILYIGVFLVIYILEKRNTEFKKVSKRMIGYFIISSTLNIVFSIFAASHLLKGVFVTFSGIVCLWLIAAFVIEIVHLYVKKKIVDKILFINEKIGLIGSTYLLNKIDKINRN